MKQLIVNECLQVAREDGVTFEIDFVATIAEVFGAARTIASMRQDLLKGKATEIDHMNGAGFGQLCELFDGDEPQRPNGAIASVRSVGELLRCYVEDVLNENPETTPQPPKVPAPHPPLKK